MARLTARPEANPHVVVESNNFGNKRPEHIPRAPSAQEPDHENVQGYGRPGEPSYEAVRHAALSGGSARTPCERLPACPLLF